MYIIIGGETRPICICTADGIEGSYLSGQGVILQDARAGIDFCM